MDYVFVLKEEKTTIIKKFNNLKKWFISNSYSKFENKIFYVYENEIDTTASYFLNFYLISPNVFPMLNSYFLHNNSRYSSHSSIGKISKDCSSG